jgi:hypothetical protein
MIAAVKQGVSWAGAQGELRVPKANSGAMDDGERDLPIYSLWKKVMDAGF